MTSFRATTMFRGTDSMMSNILHIYYECEEWMGFVETEEWSEPLRSVRTLDAAELGRAWHRQVIR